METVSQNTIEAIIYEVIMFNIPDEDKITFLQQEGITENINEQAMKIIKTQATRNPNWNKLI